MNAPRTRRDFLADVGRGMLIAGVGYGAAVELGLSPAWSDDTSQRLQFGPLEPLVDLMQGTPPGRLMPLLVDRIRSGTDLGRLVAAAALANARTFGGEDYVGFHTMMALAPAYHMAGQLSAGRRPLPVLKVLYRNSQRIQDFGGGKTEVLQAVQAGTLPPGQHGGELLRDAVRRVDLPGAERTFATISRGTADEAFNQLLYAVQDNTEVHRVVLPYRAWNLLDFIGKEHAHTLLRQSVHYCVKSERNQRHDARADEPRTVLPAMLEGYHLLEPPAAITPADDAWVERMSGTIFESTPAAAAEAAAAALAEGITPEAVGEAVSLAANQLILRDPGRRTREAPNKPPGSVHGDSIGVHACDSANAWRNIARASNPRNMAASLILGAYQVALDRVARGGDFLHWQPWPVPEQQERVRNVAPADILRETESAIRANDQARAAALVHRHGELGGPAQPVFDLLLRYAVSEDGALHAEKYYQTVAEEFAATRPAFRWRQLVALARVTASEYGVPAPGYRECCELLKG